MPLFSLRLVRVEHQVYSFEIEADTEEAAKEKAMQLRDSDDFDWDDYDVVHAEEFFN